MKVAKVSTKEDFYLLNKLIQEYEAEFSKITKKQINESGLYELDCDLEKTDNYFLYQDNTVVGFCVKGNTEARHDIYEFYVIPKERGKNLGEKFAQNIFQRYKGPWQVRQIEGADKAVLFWRKTIKKFTDNNYTEEKVKDPYWGLVTRQIFESQ